MRVLSGFLFRFTLFLPSSSSMHLSLSYDYDYDDYDTRSIIYYDYDYYDYYTNSIMITRVVFSSVFNRVYSSAWTCSVYCIDTHSEFCSLALCVCVFRSRCMSIFFFSFFIYSSCYDWYGLDIHRHGKLSPHHRRFIIIRKKHRYSSLVFPRGFLLVFLF